MAIICPLSKTIILSLFFIVEILCAMMRVVLNAEAFSIAFFIFSSVDASNELVGSSRINYAGFFNMARAIEILCFSPPDKFSPFSCTIVS